jgi:hypothetical protein
MGDTALLKDVRNIAGEIVADHTWVGFTKSLRDSEAKPGDMIKFVARVVEYAHASNDFSQRYGEWEFGFGRISNVRVVSRD